MNNTIRSGLALIGMGLCALTMGSCATTDSQSTNNSSGNGNTTRANAPSNSGANVVSTAANTISNTAASITTPSPADFMVEAAHGGMAEVEMGKLAASKAQNAEVKKFGQMMVADHGKANAELKALAAKKAVTLPTDLGSHKSTFDELNSLSGAEFDKAYVDAMVDDHEATVADFQKQADNSTDAEVKAFATKTLPVLKKHLEEIKAIQSKMP